MELKRELERNRNMHHLGCKFRVLTSEVLNFFFPPMESLGTRSVTFPPLPWWGELDLGLRDFLIVCFQNNSDPNWKNPSTDPWCRRLTGAIAGWKLGVYCGDPLKVLWERQKRQTPRGRSNGVNLNHTPVIWLRGQFFQNVSWKYSKINFLDIISYVASMSTSGL